MAVHIYTQTIHRTTQITTNVEECWPCPVFASFTLAFTLQLRKKHVLWSFALLYESFINFWPVILLKGRPAASSWYSGGLADQEERIPCRCQPAVGFAWSFTLPVTSQWPVSPVRHHSNCFELSCYLLGPPVDFYSVSVELSSLRNALFLPWTDRLLCGALMQW